MASGAAPQAAGLNLSYQLFPPYIEGRGGYFWLLIQDSGSYPVNATVRIDGYYPTTYYVRTNGTEWSKVNVTINYYLAEGIQNVTVWAVDGAGATANLSFTLDIQSPNPGAPEIRPRYLYYSITVGQSVDLNFSVTDPDGDPVYLSLNLSDGFAWAGKVYPNPGQWLTVHVPYTPTMTGYFYGNVVATDGQPGHYAWASINLEVNPPPSPPVYRVLPVPPIRVEALAMEEIAVGAILHVDRAPVPSDTVTVNLTVNGRPVFVRSQTVWQSAYAGYNVSALAVAVVNSSGQWAVAVTSQTLGVLYHSTGDLLIPRALASVANATVNLGEDVVVTTTVEPTGASAILAPYTFSYIVDGRRVDRTAMVFAVNQTLATLARLIPSAMPVPGVNGALGSFSTFEAFGLGLGSHNITVEVRDPVVGAVVLRKTFQVQVNNPFAKRIKQIKAEIDEARDLLRTNTLDSRRQARELLTQIQADIDDLRAQVAALGPQGSDLAAEVDGLRVDTQGLQATATDATSPFPTQPQAAALAAGALAVALGGFALGRRRRQP